MTDLQGVLTYGARAGRPHDSIEASARYRLASTRRFDPHQARGFITHSNSAGPHMHLLAWSTAASHASTLVVGVVIIQMFYGLCRHQSAAAAVAWQRRTTCGRAIGYARPAATTTTHPATSATNAVGQSPHEHCHIMIKHPFFFAIDCWRFMDKGGSALLRMGKRCEPRKSAIANVNQ